MLFTTTTQWVALAVALIAGWLLGLASHPGGRKWKERYAAEREAHAAARKEHDAALRDERARYTELERENARLAKAAPVTANMSTTRDYSDAEVERRPAARGWFDWDRRA